MDYFFQIFVGQISMLIGQIIDPILIFQKESYPLGSGDRLIGLKPLNCCVVNQIIINKYAV